MRHQIDKTEFDAINSADLAEAFETFVQQKHWLEVLICNGRGENEIIAVLRTDENFSHGLHNASSWLAHNGDDYEFVTLEANGDLAISFYRYDTMADAIAHSAELLASVVATI